MDSHDYLKTYATFYVNECDEFDYAKKIDMLNFIHHASESMMIDLFENGEIPSPLILDEIDDFDALMLEADYLLEFNPRLVLPGIPPISLKNLTGSLKKIKKVKSFLTKKYADADQAVKDAIKKKINTANDKIDMLQHKITGSPKPQTGLEKAVEGGKEMAQQAGEKIVGAASKAVEFAQRNPGHTAAATVAAAAVLTAGVMAYRRFFAKAGRACKDAADKGACKREYHNKGLQAQMNALSAGKSKCFKSRNPEKCKSKIDVKIAQVKNKIKG